MHKIIIVEDEDIAYFEAKLARAPSEAAKEKYRKQIELLKDTAVIYEQQGRSL